MTGRVCVIGNTNLDLVMGLLPVWPEAGTETFLEPRRFPRRRVGGQYRTRAAQPGLRERPDLGARLGPVWATFCGRGSPGSWTALPGCRGRPDCRSGSCIPAPNGAFSPVKRTSWRNGSGNDPERGSRTGRWTALSCLSREPSRCRVCCPTQTALIDHLRLAGAKVAIDPGWPGDGWTPESGDRWRAGSDVSITC